MWYMKPIRVAVDVPNEREEVFDFLDVMANHEPFTDHILRDWAYAGPPSGVGSKAQVKTKMAGRIDTIEIEVISASRPERIVEQNVGADGRRVANGSYFLDDLPDGGTRIVFEYSWQKAPISERLGAPVVRAILRRANERAMRRLAHQLAQRSDVRT